MKAILRKSRKSDADYGIPWGCTGIGETIVADDIHYRRIKFGRFWLKEERHAKVLLYVKKI